MGIPANQSLGVAASGVPPAGDLAQAVLSGKFSAVGPSQPFAFQGWANFALWNSINTTLTTTAGSLTATVASGTGLAAGVAINSKNVPAGTTWATFSGTSGTLALPSVTYNGSIDSAGNITGMAATTGLLGASVSTISVSGLAVIPSGTTVVAINSPTSVQVSPPPTSLAVNNYPQQPWTFAPTANGVTVTGGDTAATFTGAAITWNGTVNVERSFDAGATWVVCNSGGTGTLTQFTGAAVTPVNVGWQEPERGVLYRFNCVAYNAGTINYRMSQTAGAAMGLVAGGGVAY